MPMVNYTQVETIDHGHQTCSRRVKCSTETSFDQIHDDLIVAIRTLEEHVQVIEECMKAVAEAGLILNPAINASLVEMKFLFEE